MQTSTGSDSLRSQFGGQCPISALPVFFPQLLQEMGYPEFSLPLALLLHSPLRHFENAS